jgi:tetratricopeptide (TPR) repeat protein
MTLDTDTDTSVTREAQLLINIGRAKEAIPLLIRAISADPQSVDSRCLLSLALYKLERYEEALSVAGDAVVAAPQKEWPHRLRALSLMRLKRNPEALSAASLAACHGPNVPEALHILAICQADSGELKEALATANALMLLAPDSHLWNHTAGFIALRENRWVDAEAYCRKAISIEPTHWESMNNLGLALKHQGKTKEAIDRFHDSTRLNPKSATARNNLREAVGAYTSIGFTGIYVFFLVMKIFVVSTSSESRPLASCMGAIAFITIVAGNALWYWHRMAGLNKNVKFYYRTEMLRVCRQNTQGAVGRAFIALAGFGLITVLLISIIHAIFDRGHWIPMSGFCVLLVGMLVTELVTLIRRK